MNVVYVGCFNLRQWGMSLEKIPNTYHDWCFWYQNLQARQINIDDARCYRFQW